MAGNRKIFQPLCFFLSAFPRSTYTSTPFARQPPISILNYYSPEMCFALRIQSFLLIYVFKALLWTEFLMTQPPKKEKATAFYRKRY